MTTDHLGHMNPHYYSDHDVRSVLDVPVLGARSGSYSSTPLGPVNLVPIKSSINTQSPLYSLENQSIGLMGAQYENSLFSSSWSELFTRKFKQGCDLSPLGRSVDTAVPLEDDEPFESPEEVEAQTIGDLLPNDDDLLSGVIDGINHMGLSGYKDEIEDLDLFSSVGGMDLGDDCTPLGQRTCEFFGLSDDQMGGSVIPTAGEHPFGEHPSRTLFVRNINSNVEDSELMELFEQYGDIRTLYTACKHRGFVMISYYDIRSARNALKALQNKPLRRRKLDIHFSIPKDNPSEKDINQGTLVVFNLDSSVSNEELHRVFGVCGEIKEIRETPHRSSHKFIEFYDVRAAEAALHTLNRSDIAGKRIKLEHSRHGRRLMHQLPMEFDQEESGPCMQPYTTCDSTSVFPVSHAPPVSPFLENALPGGNSCSVANSFMNPTPGSFIEPSQIHRYLKLGTQRLPGIHPHSLPEYHEGLTTGSHINSITSEIIENGNLGRIAPERSPIEFTDVAGNGGESSCHYTWSRSHQLQPSNRIWPSSNSFINGLCAGQPPRSMNGFPCGLSPILRTGGPLSLHHVGSAPTINPSIWDKQCVFSRESPEASGFLPGSGGMRISKSQVHAPYEFIPQGMFSPVGGLQSHHPSCLLFPGSGQVAPVMGACDAPKSRRNESLSGQAESKKQYELDIDRIMRGEDNRTTLMIKNIPNKYTSKMLLATIDEHHRGTYDFVYLPIDFKNKCNVGYAFINMTDPSQIIPFYQAFNGKKWEKFNSEKVASLAYARIQGKTALIAHFQNSSLMNEDKRCRPILFHTEGPNAGDQVPFPMGVNVRSRSGRARTGEDCLTNPADIEAIVSASRDTSASC